MLIIIMLAVLPEPVSSHPIHGTAPYMVLYWVDCFLPVPKKIQKITIKMKRFKTIIDVRTREEYASGSVVQSINIPLNEIPDRLEDIRQMEQPIVLCCASGGRSGQATSFLKNQGISCDNGGSWMDVNYLVNQNI